MQVYLVRKKLFYFNFVSPWLLLHEFIWYYASIKLGFCWLKPTGYVFERRFAELSNGISSKKVFQRKGHG
jgi:hypothetical protein